MEVNDSLVLDRTQGMVLLDVFPVISMDLDRPSWEFWLGSCTEEHFLDWKMSCLKGN